MIAPDSYAGKLWLETMADRRGAVEKLLFPLLLALPFALVGPMRRHWAEALGFLALFTGVMGGAVVLSRERREGMFDRLRLLPHRTGRYALEFAVASAAVDLIQLLPAFLLLHGAAGAMDAIPQDLLSLILAALVANLMGMLFGFAAESGGQVHLYAALGSFATAYLSGLFSARGVAVVTQWGFPFAAFGLEFGEALKHWPGALAMTVFLGCLVWILADRNG